MLDNGLQEYKARRLEEVDAVPDLEEEVPVINFGDDDVEDDEIFSMGRSIINHRAIHCTPPPAQLISS